MSERKFTTIGVDEAQFWIVEEKLAMRRHRWAIVVSFILGCIATAAVLL
jgi:hypothetical protein